MRRVSCRPPASGTGSGRLPRMTTLLTTLLEVFPGWPQAAQGSALDWILLLFVGPFALGAVIAVLFNASRWRGSV